MNSNIIIKHQHEAEHTHNTFQESERAFSENSEAHTPCTTEHNTHRPLFLPTPGATNSANHYLLGALNNSQRLCSGFSGESSRRLSLAVALLLTFRGFTLTLFPFATAAAHSSHGSFFTPTDFPPSENFPLLLLLLLICLPFFRFFLPSTSHFSPLVQHTQREHTHTPQNPTDFQPIRAGCSLRFSGVGWLGAPHDQFFNRRPLDSLLNPFSSFCTVAPFPVWEKSPGSSPSPTVQHPQMLQHY